jgi:hypothetical protein
MTYCSIFTRIRNTFIDVDFAVVSSEGRYALALIATHYIYTGSIMKTRVREALVNFYLAMISSETRDACARIPIQRLIQVALLKHGLDEHSSTSFSQCAPVIP